MTMAIEVRGLTKQHAGAAARREALRPYSSFCAAPDAGSRAG